MSEPVIGTRDQTPEEVARIIPPAPAFAAGDTVPGLSSWLLDRRLGGGGFGEVWLARHAWNAKEAPRAVKFCLDPAARNRLVTHERNVVVRVMKYAGDHPNVVPLLDCNLDGEIPWLMYEFVEGGTLAGAIEQWRELPLPKRLGRAVRTLHAIAGALARFHRFDPPLVHRDMKPHNVLMAGAVPRITDFGIGSVVMQPKADGETGALTAYAARLPSALQGAGTPNYAPPEQRLGSTPDPRDDVYALGIIAYQMVMADLMTAPGADATLELRDLKVPGELVSLIVKSVAMNPDRRPADAAEWEATLAALLQKSQKQSEPVDTSVTGSKAVLLPDAAPTDRPARTGPPPIPPPRPTELPPEPRPVARPVWSDRGREKPAKRRFVAILVGSVLALGLVVGIAMSLLPSGKQSEPSKPTDRAEQPMGGNPPVPKERNSEVNPPGPKEGETPDPDPVPAKAPTADEARDIEIADSVKMTFCWIPSGECQLGSPKAEQDYITQTLFKGKRPTWLDDETEAKRGKYKTNGFWMGKYTVTQAEWIAVMGSNPSHFDWKKDNTNGLDTSRFPVENVSWDMICGKDGKGGFLEKVNAHGGIRKAFGKAGTFALPHEDAWEYACRGGLGNTRAFYWGDQLNGTEANCEGNVPYGTATKGDSLGRTCAVDFTNEGKYKPHPWGLMHMHGNVWQWCEKVYDKTNVYVICGGSWYDSGHRSRAARRSGSTPDYLNEGIGFRLVIRLD